MKKIFDPVHGFIKFNDQEGDLIDSRPFQRLHDIRQLGIAYLVYPGGTHTRFEHSLGTMELASKVFDTITEKAERIDQDLPYWRRILRMAALCHDLGHLPFSHVAEVAVLGDEGHEGWTRKIVESEELQPVFEGLDVQAIARLAIGEGANAWERLLSEIITGDFFGVDRIDYLLRDARSTGVSYGLFDYQQLIEMLYITDEFELGVEANGVESCEALLLARHFMHKRVYKYGSVKAYSLHLSKFITRLFEKLQPLESIDSYLAMSDCVILSALKEASRNGDVEALRITDRKRRFRALPITEEIDVKELKKSLDIPDDAIAHEPVKTTKAKRIKFSQLVIPSESKGWLFVDPKFAKGVENAVY